MTTCGTPYWTAPEILLGKVYNESVDAYSYGMVLWELWTCKTPFQGMAAMEVAVQVASGEVSLLACTLHTEALLLGAMMLYIFASFVC